jgi:5'-phosphate synthase pdxT subunit
MLIGVLGLQGDFDAHRKVMEKLGAKTIVVRRPEDLAKSDGLIIPGGESTAITKLLFRHGLVDAIASFHLKGGPIFGTCAGMIVLAKNIESHPKQFRFGFIDISVNRNAYGRQIDSFEEDIAIPPLGRKPFRAVFIRAPMITKLGRNVISLAQHKKEHVFAREGSVLVCSFHPELTGDARIHRYFLKMAKAIKNKAKVKKK